MVVFQMAYHSLAYELLILSLTGQCRLNCLSNSQVTQNHKPTWGVGSSLSLLIVPVVSPINFPSTANIKIYSCDIWHFTSENCEKMQIVLFYPCGISLVLPPTPLPKTCQGSGFSYSPPPTRRPLMVRLKKLLIPALKFSETVKIPTIYNWKLSRNCWYLQSTIRGSLLCPHRLYRVSLLW